jgi:hypothetical protein
MKRTVLLVAAIALSSPALAQKVEPGEWQIVSTVSSPLFPKPETKTERHCVKKEEVDDPKNWMGQMAPDCKVTPGKQTADSYSWQVSCPKTGMRGRGTLRWTRTTMEIDMETAGTVQGRKFEMRSKVAGKRVGPCKK